MEYLTVEEAAELLGLSPAAIRRRAASGELPATKSGKQWLIRSDNLPAGQPFLARDIPPTPQVDFTKALLQVSRLDISELWVPDILRHEDQLAVSDQIIDLAARRFSGEPPGATTEVDVAKTPFFTRSAVLISIEDRVAYQAAVGTLAERASAQTPDSVFSARISSNPRYFLKKGISMWLDWHKRVRKEIESGKPWMIKTDLVSYFDHIPHNLLLDEVSAMNPDPEVTNVIRQMLEMWSVVPGIGIPQGPNASRLLGNIYLFPVDHAMTSGGYSYFRYMDDIRIVGATRAEVTAGMRLLEKECRRRGLAVSPSKTEMLNGKEALADGSRKDRDMASYFLNIGNLTEARHQLKGILFTAFEDDGHLNASAARFSLWRLGWIRDSTVLQMVIDRLQDLAPAASVVASYLRHFLDRDYVVDGLTDFFSNPAKCYSTYLATWLFAAMVEKRETLPDQWVHHAEKYCKDRNQPTYLRAVAASVFARGRRPADITWLKSEARREWDPILLRGYAVALHRAGALDNNTAKILAAKSQVLTWTIDYLNKHQSLPSMLERESSIWIG
jgi:excisionase family DNA binding protein